MLVGIDTATGKNISNPYNFSISGRQSDATYNISENCFYCIHENTASNIELLRYHLDTKKTDIITYSSNSLMAHISLGGLFYNNTTKKFYFTYPSASGYGDKVYELSISGSKFSLQASFLNDTSAYTDDFTVDDNTGNLYFTEHATTNHLKVLTPGNTTPKDIGDVDVVYNIKFNKNDNMLYGIRSLNSGTASLYKNYLVKIDPTVGTISVIKNLDFIEDKVRIVLALDPCSNSITIAQQGVPKRGYDRLDLIDITNGNLIKEFIPQYTIWQLQYIRQ